MNQRVRHHHASDVGVDKTHAAHTNNSTNTCFTSRLKDIQICIHAAVDPERATQTVFSTPHHYVCVTDIQITEVLG